MNSKKRIQINMRVSEKNLKMIQRLANSCHMTVTSYLLKCAFDKEIVIVSQKNLDAILTVYSIQSELIQELKKQGVNINQMAHALNGQRSVLPNEYVEMKNAYEKVFDLFNDEMNEVGGLKEIGRVLEHKRIKYDLIDSEDYELDEIEDEIKELLNEDDALKLLNELNVKNESEEKEMMIDIVNNDLLTIKEKVDAITNKGMENMTEDELLFILDHADGK